eukprot:TRINITY_DN4462_c0_g1_i2.p1 TRINITY_DN4462_c0_g1~~TRINITY_DN4462_c0_g1_i2.p1  ORF type:complete len:469 (-),score=120.74 TRINITY_DN4462_c0_g1_i2:8-1414(-)
MINKLIVVVISTILIKVCSGVQVWETTLDQSVLLQRQGDVNPESGNPNNNIQVTVNSDTYQEIYGFGGALTESAGINLLYVKSQNSQSYWNTLNGLFSPSEGAGFTMVRVPMGSSDLSVTPYYTYDETSNPPDWFFADWSWQRDTTNILPVLKDILTVNPNIKILITPWSAPTWQKTSAGADNAFYWGSLADNMYDDFAFYFQTTIQKYQAEGINIYALTLQNEPQNEPNSYPVMRLSAQNETALVKLLGPKLSSNNINTKILVWDHNWDQPDYPMDILSDQEAYNVVDGSAFHCYGGDVSAQSQVHDQYPNKEIWFTECSGTFANNDWSTNIQWNTNNLYFGAIQNWASTVLHWSFAMDPTGQPHAGGCDNCRGIVTVGYDHSTVTYNEEYYGMAMISKFLKYPAYRLDCSLAGGWGCMGTTCFKNGDGSIVVAVSNFCQTPQDTVIENNGQYVNYTVNVGLTTFVW